MKVFDQVWYGVPAGAYTVKARATDMAGLASESAVSLVQVRAPVSAGGGGSTGGSGDGSSFGAGADDDYGADGLWANGEVHPWRLVTGGHKAGDGDQASIVGGYDVIYKASGGGLIAGKVKKDGGQQVGGILLPVDVDLDRATNQSSTLTLPIGNEVACFKNTWFQHTALTEGRITSGTLGRFLAFAPRHGNKWPARR